MSTTSNTLATRNFSAVTAEIIEHINKGHCTHTGRVIGFKALAEARGIDLADKDKLKAFRKEHNQLVRAVEAAFRPLAAAAVSDPSQKVNQLKIGTKKDKVTGKRVFTDKLTIVVQGYNKKELKAMEGDTAKTRAAQLAKENEELKARLAKYEAEQAAK